MSIITKVFIVLTLIMAVIFQAHIQQYYHVRENYKAELIRAEGEITDLQEQVTRLGQDKSAVVAALNNEISNKDSRIKTLIGQLSSKDQRIASLEEQVRTGIREKADVARQLDNALANATQSSQRLADLERKAEDARRSADSAQEQLELAMDNAAQEEQRKVSYREKVNDLASQLNDVQDELYSANIRLQAYADTYGAIDPTSAIPVVKGSVVGVGDDFQTVVIDLGSKDQVKVGYVFSIRRGNQFIGKARVDSVDEDMCVAFIMNEFMRDKVRELDDVSTR